MSQPITVSITRLVDAQRSAQIEVWVRAGQDLARQFDGYLGSGWVQSHEDPSRWHMLYRFRNADSLRNWEESKERKWWMNSAAGMVQTAREERRTGIEGWFDDPEDRQTNDVVRTPPRWKQAISIFIVFFPVSLGLQVLLSPLTGDWPLPLRVFVLTATAVPLMTYIFLPASTRMLGPWLRR